MDYRKFRDHKYLNALDFEEEPRIVTIERVEQGVVDRPGEDPERVPFMYLREYDRPLILNHTNGELITAMYGTRDTRQWEGKRIVLTVGMTTDKQGKPCLGVRVKPTRPPEIEPVETEAERIARLEHELAKARSKAQPVPAELPPANPAPSTVVPEEVTHVAS